MRFLTRPEVAARFAGKTVAVVGSGPGCTDNPAGLVDNHDIVVRVNNYRLTGGTGSRCDVFYSFFGTSIRKTREQLIADGVTLCLCKLPNARVMESEWHTRNGKEIGIDYRPHYARRHRMSFWFCDTYVPTISEFMEGFRLLDHHMPTTGFAAILDVLSFAPQAVYLTGFDFFASGIHNVNEPWRHKNMDDPIRHRPDLERRWLMSNMDRYPIAVDRALAAAVRSDAAA